MAASELVSVALIRQMLPRPRGVRYGVQCHRASMLAIATHLLPFLAWWPASGAAELAISLARSAQNADDQL